MCQEGSLKGLRVCGAALPNDYAAGGGGWVVCTICPPWRVAVQVLELFPKLQQLAQVCHTVNKLNTGRDREMVQPAAVHALHVRVPSSILSTTWSPKQHQEGSAFLVVPPMKEGRMGKGREEDCGRSIVGGRE